MCVVNSFKHTCTVHISSVAVVLQSADKHAEWSVMSCAVPVHAAMEEGVLADSMGSQGVETMGGADAEALNDAQ